MNNITDALGYSKLCDRWGSHLLSHYEADGESFKSQSSLGMERESNIMNRRQRQSVAWHHPTSPQKMKCKATSSAGRVMATIVWDAEWVILANIM